MDIILIIIVIIVVVVLLIMLLYNNLVRLRTLVDNAFSSTDVILKKRYDLIPNLVEVLKGYMNYEESVLKEVTELRSRALDNSTSIDEKIKLDKDISSDVKKIFLLTEGYPEIKASENFLKLQTAIVDIENEISAARRTFNSAATEYNINIKVFPNIIFAGILGFKDVGLFETKDTANIDINMR